MNNLIRRMSAEGICENKMFNVMRDSLYPQREAQEAKSRDLASRLHKLIGEEYAEQQIDLMPYKTDESLSEEVWHLLCNYYEEVREEIYPAEPASIAAKLGLDVSSTFMAVYNRLNRRVAWRYL